MRVRLLVLVGASLLALGLAGLGCSTGRFVQRGIDCYNAANYPCAASEFQDIEAQGYDLNPKGRCRYLVYRGLTHWRMGQMDLARRFLAEGNAVYRAGDPQWLSPDVFAQMNQALIQLQGGGPVPPGAAPTPAEPTTIQ